MTEIDKAIKTGHRLTRNAASAASTARDGGEMLQASGDVISARLGIMAAGMVDPLKADLTEMSLMSTEKVEALTASVTAVAQTFGGMGERLGANALTEAGLATRAASAMATALTPAGVMQAQYSYAVGWWSRAAGQMLTLNTELLKAQAAALHPIHKTAVANAKRLKK